jgi:DNA polymerase-3 subunit alpha
MQEICRKLKPQGLEDLAALNALYRPGPLDGGMVDDFIARHHGLKSVRYIVPEMKEVLSNTYGILVYQEQIMQLAQKLGGYSLGEADLMRRAMGKKNREEMARHEEKFIGGAVEKGIKREKAQQIFSLMAQFADYGFNRSHSVAYAYLAFQTAYLKAHYPEHFYAAVLSNELQDTAKVFKYSMELRGQGIELLAPDVNESGAGFTPLQGAIRYGLAAIKGIGQASVNAVIEARKEGWFKSFYEFAERLGAGAINRRVLESLVCAGAFDSINKSAGSLHEWRSRLHSAIDMALSRANRAQRSKAQGQNDLFAGFTTQQAGSLEELPAAENWTHAALLAAEKNAIGFYITGNPLDNFTDVLSELRAVKTSELAGLESGVRISIGGIVTTLQLRSTKKGSRFALLRLEDQAGGIKCVLWPETFSKYETAVQNDAAVLMTGRLEVTDDGQISLIADEVARLDDVLQRRARSVTIKLPVSSDPKPLLDRLFQLLDANRGDCEVFVEMNLEGGVLVRARPHGALRIKGSVELESSLQSCGCQVEWRNVTLSR